MGPIATGLREALHLILSGDPETFAIARRTLSVALVSTGLAAAFGMPLGVILGGPDFRGRRSLSTAANIGLALPPVAVGQILWILMWPDSRWGGGLLAGLGWLYTIDAVVLAQSALALPVIAAITAAAARSVPAGLSEQARAFGAGRTGALILLAREARAGLITALIAGLGTTMATVGAILIVGTSLDTATLATATVSYWNAGGNDGRAIACGTILLALFAVLAGLFTVLQRGGSRWLAMRPS